MKDELEASGAHAFISTPPEIWLQHSTEKRTGGYKYSGWQFCIPGAIFKWHFFEVFN